MDEQGWVPVSLIAGFKKVSNFEKPIFYVHFLVED